MSEADIASLAITFGAASIVVGLGLIFRARAILTEAHAVLDRADKRNETLEGLIETVNEQIAIAEALQNR